MSKKGKGVRMDDEQEGKKDDDVDWEMVDSGSDEELELEPAAPPVVAASSSASPEESTEMQVEKPKYTAKDTKDRFRVSSKEPGEGMNNA